MSLQMGKYWPVCITLSGYVNAGNLLCRKYSVLFFLFVQMWNGISDKLVVLYNPENSTFYKVGIYISSFS